MNPNTKCSLILLTLFALLTLGHLNAPNANGQNWATNQSPVNSVPQYIPRYPLGNTTNQGAGANEPAAGLKQRPSAGNSKVVPKATTTTPKVKRPAKSPVKKPTSSKSSSAKKAAAKKAKDAKAKKKPEKIEPHYGVDYSVHRDRNVYPIDPRKPCSPCTQPCGTKTCGGCGGKLFGNHGRPYQETEPGGCTCQKKKPTNHPMFSVHWPRPFSGLLDERNPEKAAARYSPCQEPKCVDALNHLSKLKLSSYKRTDNAYCGSGADPYGCLSESKQAMRIATAAPAYYHSAEVENAGVQTAQFQSVVGDLDSSGDRFGSFGWPTMR